MLRSIKITSGWSSAAMAIASSGGAGLPDDLDLVDPGEQRTNPLAEHSMIIDHRDLDHHGTGTRADRIVPPPGRGVISKVPPMACTRLRIEVMPIPDTYGCAMPTPSSVTASSSWR